MEPPRITAYRLLALIHGLAGILSLPLGLFFGLFGLPFIAGSIWLVVLGVRLWRPSQSLIGALRITHAVSLVMASLLCAYGVLALQAAERSAAAGGGLLGGFGLLPLGFGIALAVLALASLFISRQPLSGQR